jgi:prepilin-type N-terminal cleavage/methylation domain-containing protein
MAIGGAGGSVCDSPITFRLPQLMSPRYSSQARRLTRDASRRGFTLPEILIVIVMISVLALVAIPRFASGNAKRHQESARMRVAAALATARAAAIQKGKQVTFQIKSNRVTVDAGAGDTLMARIPLDTLYDVKVSPTSTISIVFNARGFTTMSGSQRILLQRSGLADDSVVVTKTGMVQR